MYLNSGTKLASSVLDCRSMLISSIIVNLLRVTRCSIVSGIEWIEQSENVKNGRFET